MILLIHFISGSGVFCINKQRGRLLNVEKNIFYARDYSSLPDVSPTVWWLDCTDYSLISQNEVMTRYGYATHSQIYDSGVFIPFVRVDIVALEMEYLQKFFPQYMKMIDKANADVEFKCLIERQHSVQHWSVFERQALRMAIILWCQNNRIPYC